MIEMPTPEMELLARVARHCHELDDRLVAEAKGLFHLRDAFEPHLPAEDERQAQRELRDAPFLLSLADQVESAPEHLFAFLAQVRWLHGIASGDREGAEPDFLEIWRQLDPRYRAQVAGNGAAPAPLPAQAKTGDVATAQD
jgi:hypothetical protein